LEPIKFSPHDALDGAAVPRLREDAGLGLLGPRITSASQEGTKDLGLPTTTTARPVTVNSDLEILTTRLRQHPKKIPKLLRFIDSKNDTTGKPSGHTELYTIVSKQS